MTTTQWVVTAIVALIGGGAMGAVITAFVTKYRNRRQPIAYKIEVIDVFIMSPDYQSLEVRYTKKSEEMEGIIYGKDVNNLSIAQITLINKGNQDINEFKCGVTLEGTNEAIDVKLKTPDRHHIAELMTSFDLRNPAKEIDFTLKPFNRDEEYIFLIYFTYEETPGSIKLSSPHATKFTDLKRFAEVEATIKIYRELVFKLATTVMIGVIAYAIYARISRYYFPRQDKSNFNVPAVPSPSPTTSPSQIP